MANWTTLKTAIASIIKTNGNQEITGQLLQNVLNSIINAVGENMTFVGMAEPTTSPGVPDGPVFYLASTPGTYSNFNGIEVGDNETVLLYWNNSAWTKRNAGFVNQTAFDNLKEELLPQSTEIDISSYIIEGVYWNGSETSVNADFKYANKVPVNAGELLLVSGWSGQHGLLYYYSDSGVQLYNSELSNGKACCVYAYEDGYLMINSKLSANIIVFKVHKNSTLWQISRILNNVYRGGLYYGFILNSMPELDTTKHTFTLKAGTLCIGRGLANITLDNDITIEQDYNYGTHYIVLNAKTQKLRLVSAAATTLNLTVDEYAVACVKWAECVYEGNFRRYKLNGKTIDLIPNRDYAEEIDALVTKTAAEMASQSYYQLNRYSVGDKVESLSLISHTNTYYNFNFIAYKGDKVIIKGRGSTGGSRLYMFVSTETRLVTAIAEAGVNALTTPLEFIMDEDTEVYGTSISSDCYVKLYRDVFAKRDTVVSGVVAPKMFNPILNLQREQLRVLDIGNSYTDDSTHYIPNVVTASGINVSDMCLYKATRAGASFKNWYNIYHDQDTANYSISKVVGGLSADISGTAAIGNGEKFRNTLANNEWDLIIIHQVSTYAPYYDRWEENSDAGYLSKLIRLLRKHQPKATIGFLLVHSYWSNYSGNTEKSSLQRWKLIAESAKKLRANYGIDFIIPYGTAIQNLRASSLNNNYDLTADGTHCANGLADYTAACAYFQALFAPRYGVNILGNTARITVEPTETYPSSDISVTDENAPVAQKAAFLASYNWYECINPDDIDDEDLI